MIGDPRNDENRVISQLQLLFIRFYNKIYDDIKAANPTYTASEVYEAARKSVSWHYQWIVVHEFLPTMVGHDMVHDILWAGRKFYKPQAGPYIPIEFSVAAYRFGHSMIPAQLRLQGGGPTKNLFSSDFGRGFTPIQNLGQVVEWDQFFEINGSHQLATKLDVKMSSELLALPFITDPGVPAHQKSLATRNLLRANSFLLPSGQAVAGCMHVNQADIDRVVDTVHDLINGKNINLSAGIPLWFYILAEDGVPGEGLGPVGGRIVAEVLMGLMESDPTSYLSENRNWVPTLTNTGDFTMKDLVQYV